MPHERPAEAILFPSTGSDATKGDAGEGGIIILCRRVKPNPDRQIAWIENSVKPQADQLYTQIFSTAIMAYPASIEASCAPRAARFDCSSRGSTSHSAT